MLRYIKSLPYQLRVCLDKETEEQIGQLIHDYSEEVEWDDSLNIVYKWN
jgi:hypothetical protein